MSKIITTVILAAMLLSQNAFAQTACDLGIYSQYVGGTGGVPDHRPVIQGGCTKTFDNGVYVNGWVSQSLHNPGLEKTFGNEIDLVAGWSGKLGEKWSVDIHTAYYDLANPKLLSGTNGDLTDIGGTLRYQATAATSVYVNGEYYHGIGKNGFRDGGKIGLGVRTSLADIANVDVVIYHTDFLDNGKFAKVAIQPTRAIAKVFGGELRPVLTLWQPLGRYRVNHDAHAVVGVVVNW